MCVPVCLPVCVFPSEEGGRLLSDACASVNYGMEVENHIILRVELPMRVSEENFWFVCLYDFPV